MNMNARQSRKAGFFKIPQKGDFFQLLAKTKNFTEF